MKGIQGLLVAITLGIAGAIFNFAYLSTRDVERVYFIGIKPGVTVARGDQLLEDHLEKVGIPRDTKGNLEEFAILFSARNTVINQNVWRQLNGGSLLLRDDLKTPPGEISFGSKDGAKDGASERAVGVPIDTRKFVPSLVVPGDWVTFIIPGVGDTMPTPAIDPDADPQPATGPAAGATPAPAAAAPAAGRPAGTVTSRPAAPTPARPSQMGMGLVGPFKVLSIGNRLGSIDVMKAARVPQLQENVMMILVKVDESGRLEPKAEQLVRVLDRTNSQPLCYLLHPRNQPPKGK